MSAEPPTAGGEAEPERERQPGSGRRFLHLAVLSALFFAQPLFTVTNPGLYVGYRSSPADVFIAATLIVLAPPALLWGLEQLAARRSAPLAARVHLVFVGALAAMGASTLLIGAGNSGVQTLVALAAGLAFALAYRRFRLLRAILTALSPVPALFLVVYLLVSPVADFTLGTEEGVRIERVEARTPIVMIVLDEVPSTSLMNRRERVDAGRYPNFARLARTSTWFRGATTVNWETHRAVPALLSGEPSGPEDVPSAVDHPRNLFTLLGGSHDLNVSEPYTDLCPERLCPEAGEGSVLSGVPTLLARLARVSARIWVPGEIHRRLGLPEPQELSDVDPAAQTDRFVANLGPRRRAEGRPRLDFMHVLLPHVPWERMPSGKRYPLAETGTFVGLKGQTRWNDDRWRVQQSHQRHLLQLAYTDRVLGRILDRLGRTGALDRSLVVLVADHGVSFRPDEERREANSSTAPDILPVPFFVKRPGQRRGQVVDRHVETIDVLATIADVLDVPVPFETQGRSAFRPHETEPTIRLGSGDRLTLSLAELRRRRRAALYERIAVLGTGPAYPTLFQVGPHRGLVGRRVADLPRGDSGSSAAIPERDAITDFDPQEEVIPTRITGTLSEGGGARDLAVALNGVIEATTRTHVGDDRSFSAMVPEQALRDGGNRIQLFEIAGGGRTLEEISID